MIHRHVQVRAQHSKEKCTSERPKYTSERPSGGSGADGWQTSQQPINQFNGACHVCGHKWRWLQK